MKRVALAAMVAVAIASSFAACGGGDDAGKASAAAATAVPGSPAATPSGDRFVDALAKLNYTGIPQAGTTLGKPDAPVTIEMYEDFACSHCMEFTALLEAGIVEQLVKPGKAKLEFHYFPLRQASVVPMVAAECAADQNRFWDYQKRLFTEQAIADALPPDKGGEALATAFGEAALKGFAKDLGLDSDKFATCFAGQPPLQRIQDDLRKVEKQGMQGTPTFVVNGKALLSGSPSTVAEWKTLVESTK
jgi:protein-disulfide isomerase